MLKRTEVVICLGSSCFSRGNKNLLKVIAQYIIDKKIEDRINFHGGHCFGSCAEGPILKINENLYTGVDEQKVVDILNSHFEI